MKIKPYEEFETSELVFTLSRTLESIAQLEQSSVARAKWSVSVLKENIAAIEKAILDRKR